MSLPTLQFLLDLAGTFVFALSGAMAGVRRRLDLFGVLVLSFAAANSGGLIRDVIIGATPPAAIDDWRYLGVSLLAGIITFCFPAAVRQQWNPVPVSDAAGLALFAVSGAHKALEYGLNPIMATLLGMVTGIGGGMARDILLTDVPAVLRAESVCRGGTDRCGDRGGGTRASTASRTGRAGWSGGGTTNITGFRPRRPGVRPDRKHY